MQLPEAEQLRGEDHQEPQGRLDPEDQGLGHQQGDPATGRTGTWVPGLGMRDIQAGVVTLTTPPQEKPEESNSALQIEKTRTGPLTTTFPSSLEMYYGLVSLLLD